MTDTPIPPGESSEPPPAGETPAPRSEFSISLRFLLLLVCLIGLLLAALTPWYQARLIRTHVSQVIADQRSMVTALESYFIDMMAYPACGTAEGPARIWPDWPQYGRGNVVRSTTKPIPANVRTVHSHLRVGSGARRTITFQLPRTIGVEGWPIPHTLTTPISYLVSYPTDPFSDVSGATFGYMHDMAGYIVWSPGPDGDAAQCGDIGASVEHLYHSHVAQPSPAVIAQSYDPTNGTRSDGDIIRVRQ